jgi:hypothetical protein
VGGKRKKFNSFLIKLFLSFFGFLYPHHANERNEVRKKIFYKFLSLFPFLKGFENAIKFFKNKK